MGTQNIAVSALKVATYRVTDTNRAPYQTTTALYYLQGAAGKTIELQQAVLRGVATSGGQAHVVINKRTSINAGGTVVALNASYDTNRTAPSGTAYVITTAPTYYGTLQGGIATDLLEFTVSGTPIAGTDLVFDFTSETNAISPPPLNNANEMFEFNFGSFSTLAGNAIDFMMAWTER